jgi:hypothetical protein
MASLKTMPPIVLTTARLVEIGKHSKLEDSELPKKQGELVGKLTMTANAFRDLNRQPVFLRLTGSVLLAVLFAAEK